MKTFALLNKPNSGGFKYSYLQLQRMWFYWQVPCKGTQVTGNWSFFLKRNVLVSTTSDIYPKITDIWKTQNGDSKHEIYLTIYWNVSSEQRE